VHVTTGPGRILLAVAFTLGAPIALLGWLWLVERATGLLPRRAAAWLRPVLWLAPALVMVGVFLLWPLLYTGILSFRNAAGRGWRGLDNYGYLATDSGVHSALKNNVLWLVLLVAGCTLIGLLVATLSDAVRYESVAKAIIVAPIAISFVCGAVIWRFMFDYQPPGVPQTGTLNAVYTGLTGKQPVAWLVNQSTNNVALIVVGIWMTTGFATVILSAAIKSMPVELLEAARVDGATGWQAFRNITIPHIRPTITVVATLLAVMALKAFDIVYVMTNGNYNTDVIANVMYRELFIAQDYGKASAVAVLLTVLALPIVIINAHSSRRQEATQ
jgi:alpha-glucoside transport system permease protein